MEPAESYEFEDRRYLSPTLSSGEQEAFIDNLRNIQSQNNAQIAQQTQNLGTNVPSNLGGLGGGEAYFNSRYQTPQVNEQVTALKSAAQAQALNDVMKDYQAQLQNRYKQKYREFTKAQRNHSLRHSNYNTPLGGGTNPNNGDPLTTGNVNTHNTSLGYGKLGVGKGIAASPDDVPDGETYSTVFVGAVDENGNPISPNGGTVTQNAAGKVIWRDTRLPSRAFGTGGGSSW